MYVLVEILFCIIDIMFLDIFAGTVLERKKLGKKYIKYILIVSIGVAIHVCTYFNMYTNVLNFMALVLMIVYTIVAFNDRPQNKVLISIIFNIGLGTINSATLNILSRLTNTSLKLILRLGTPRRIILVCIIKVIVFMVIKIVKYFILSFKLDIPNKYKYMMFFMFAISFGSIGIIFEMSLINQNPKLSMYICIIIITFMLFNIAILILIQRISHYMEEEATNNIILMGQSNLQKSILEIEKKQQEINKIKHDMLNHYGVIEYLIENKRQEESLTYIKDLKAAVEATKMYYKTGNMIADAVINQKVKLGQEYGIDFDLKIFISENIQMKSIDLGAMLSNLLDNAIEASKEVEVKNRKITVNIHPHKESLLIDISNTVLSNPIKGDTLLRRPKTNPHKHGYGMKSIKYIVDKYDGYMNYKCENNIFNISILVKTSVITKKAI